MSRTSHLAGEAQPPAQRATPPRPRFAFLAHLLDPSSLVHFDPALRAFSDEQLCGLLDSWQGLIRPAVVGRTTVTSPTGLQLEGEFIALFLTTAQMLALPKEDVIAQLQEAVDLAVAGGAEVIGLGGYTSIISQGGRLLNAHGVPLTTGNSFTAVTAIQAVEKACAMRGRELEKSRVCVVGAAGSIGAALTQALGGKVGALSLVGNPGNPQQSMMRLHGLTERMVGVVQKLDASSASGRLAQTLREAFQAGLSTEQAADTVVRGGVDAPVVCTTSLADVVPTADVVIACTSSPEVLITPEMVKPGAIICDLSVPHNLPRSFVAERSDVLLFDGGVLRVPGQPDLGWNFGLARGLAFACMCETMLIGMEPVELKRCAGPLVSVENIDLLSDFGERHGFELEDFRCFGEAASITH